jgi:hypothetical protein
MRLPRGKWIQWIDLGPFPRGRDRISLQHGI